MPSYSHSTSTPGLPLAPPDCHFSSVASSQVDLLHSEYFIFLAHQICIFCLTWQLSFNNVTVSDCWNCRDFLMIWVPLKCFAILWLSASPCGGWNAWIVATCSRTFSCYNDFEKKVRCINSGDKSKVALRSSIHPFPFLHQIWWWKMSNLSNLTSY